MVKLYLGSDHAGYEAKEKIKKILEKEKILFLDLGTKSEDSVDYVDFAKKVCKRVLNNKDSYGILICGSGTGMQMAANKIKGIRASFSYDTYSAEMARFDNDANVLTLRARKFNHLKYKSIIFKFIETEFSKEDRHKKRINKLKKLENEKK